jgi:hypothetical protein
MEKSIMLVLVGNRKESAVEVQKVLTETGCFIKTRLGLHDGTPEQCTNTGLIILELMGDAPEKKALFEKLKVIPHVNVEMVELSV